MKNFKLIVMALVAIFTLASCRPAASRKGVQIVEKVAKSLSKGVSKSEHTVAETKAALEASERAAQKARTLVGKEVKIGERAKFIARYGDDVAKHLEFDEQQCSYCSGSGYKYGDICSHCDGDGYVYKVKYK